MERASPGAKVSMAAAFALLVCAAALGVWRVGRKSSTAERPGRTIPPATTSPEPVPGEMVHSSTGVVGEFPAQSDRSAILKRLRACDEAVGQNPTDFQSLVDRAEQYEALGDADKDWGDPRPSYRAAVDDLSAAIKLGDSPAVDRCRTWSERLNEKIQEFRR